MSLSKGIEHGREHRKPYYRAKSCRPHTCLWCQAGRLHRHAKKILTIEEEIEEISNSSPEDS